jgi:hypothetical protein
MPMPRPLLGFENGLRRRADALFGTESDPCQLQRSLFDLERGDPFGAGVRRWKVKPPAGLGPLISSRS